MDQDLITFYSYTSGILTFLLLLPVAFYLQHIKAASYTLVLAVTGSLIWHLLIVLNYYPLPLDKPALLILETVRYGAWITALLSSLRFTSNSEIPKKFRFSFNGIWIAALFFATALYITQHQLAKSSSWLIWNNLILSIAVFIAVEQLYKNASEFRLVKLWSLVIGAVFGYDIYLFAHSLIFDQISPQLWQARGAINSASAIILLAGSLFIARRRPQKSRLALSRPVAFYTTSMTAAGTFLSLMAIGGYYIQLHGGNWGNIIQVLLLFMALLAITTIFISRTVRSKLNVWVNKYFFRHKYDYREEWLQLIQYLSRTPDEEDFNQRAITAVASIFKSRGGALWMAKNNQFFPIATQNLTLPTPQPSESSSSPLCKFMLEREWVFLPHSKSPEDKEANQRLPEWIYGIKDAWILLPLLIEQELIGFMLLTNPKQSTQLGWEDLDLLKTVGRQIASYLDRHNAAEMIAESRQFDAFNKLTAFIMHDLKNLIAQQGLVVDNAAKHKDNPAFVEDAIHTIENSVNRMSILLKKLQHNQPSELRALELHRVLMEATKKCQSLKPSPSLRLENTDLVINADPDHLIMTFIHLIKNAQEATTSEGFVDVILRRQDNNAIITIEDNGEGMDDDFIRNNLFKPFVTTKSGKGMGIGVYQAREFLHSLDGELSVVSKPKVGTTFTITIPANRV